MPDVKAIRDAILHASLETSNHGDVPLASTLYVPLAHVKALGLEASLVVGSRGVGKSFWTAALDSRDLRALLQPEIKDLDRTDVHIGFSVRPLIDQYPDESTFALLLDQEYDPYDIWRAVVRRWLETGVGGKPGRPERWTETVRLTKEDPEFLASLAQAADRKFADLDRFGLIVFDALDRTSSNWGRMDQILRGLLRTVLWLKSFPRLHGKVFLREDQFERTVTNFPDASKLLSTKEDLNWARHDLHGLLWQRLVNAPAQHGEVLRSLFMPVFGKLPMPDGAGFRLPEKARKESPEQRALFEALAGPWMGGDIRRGVPYVWSVGHLADGRGQTSPRSFLAAIRQAAEDSWMRYQDHPKALHYESIKRGIQKASEIRVNEMAEDFPWVRVFLDKLRSLNVPCDFAALCDRWEGAFPGGPASERSGRLPAQDVERGWQGILEDLVRLGVLERKSDGRIDMPDLYRVGFGLGRKGGVKPRKPI